jgi:CheY-like chemotaxis protein
VRVTTRLGEGTRFTVHLPCARDLPAPRYQAVDAAPRRLEGETVLVCEDDDDVRRLLVDVLNLRGYRLLEARNGSDALVVAARCEGPIHVLVTDLVMPELGGIELATQLRKRDPALRVIYTSGYTEDADRLSDPLGPNTRFLAKPFLPGDLTRAVFAMLEQGA